MITLLCALHAHSIAQIKVSGHWEPVPLVAGEFRKPGQIGGEGAQWPRSLAVDPTGKTVMLGIDVGGIYRSLDAGNRWEPANVGYSPRGAAAIAFDPNNPLRVIAIGETPRRVGTTEFTCQPTAADLGATCCRFRWLESEKSGSNWLLTRRVMLPERGRPCASFGAE